VRHIAIIFTVTTVKALFDDSELQYSGRLYAIFDDNNKACVNTGKNTSTNV